MIRPMLPADMRQVYRMMLRAFPDDRPTLKEWVRELSWPGVQVWVDDPGAGLLRGYIMIAGDDVRGRLVRQIVVDPVYKKQGVGSGLLALVPLPAAAWVRRDNTASRALFSRLGWSVSAEPQGEWLLYQRS